MQTLSIRSDYLPRIIHDIDPIVNLNKGCKFSRNWHYVVIDIKFSTLPLDSKKKFILNSGSFKAYKVQIWIYNECIGKIQGYTPTHGFVLGRRWKSTKSNINHSSNNCFDRLGIIEFKNKDRAIISKGKESHTLAKKIKKVWTHLGYRSTYH